MKLQNGRNGYRVDIIVKQEMSVKRILFRTMESHSKELIFLVKLSLRIFAAEKYGLQQYNL